MIEHTFDPLLPFRSSWWQFWARLMFCGSAKYGVSSVSIHALLCLLACGGRVQLCKLVQPRLGRKRWLEPKRPTPPSPSQTSRPLATSYLAQIYWPPPLCTSKFEQLCKSQQSILQILVPRATRRKYWGCCILEEGEGSLSAHEGGLAVAGNGTTSNKQPQKLG